MDIIVADGLDGESKVGGKWRAHSICIDAAVPFLGGQPFRADLQARTVAVQLYSTGVFVLPSWSFWSIFSTV